LSQLSRFVKERTVDNVLSGRVVAVKDNPFIVDVRLVTGQTLTLPTADRITFSKEDPVFVAVPAGDLKRAYVGGRSASFFGGDPVNRIVGLDVE
jgi:hypothetical protein